MICWYCLLLRRMQAHAKMTGTGPCNLAPTFVYVKECDAVAFWAHTSSGISRAWKPGWWPERHIFLTQHSDLMLALRNRFHFRKGPSIQICSVLICYKLRKGSWIPLQFYQQLVLPWSYKTKWNKNRSFRPCNAIYVEVIDVNKCSLKVNKHLAKKESRIKEILPWIHSL